MERINNKQKKYKVVSLFSGIGGLDLGFEYAGFNVVWANDFDKYAVQTYRANVGNQIVLGDIYEQKENIPDHDILIGGFPCQPFSTLGSLKGFEDQRGTLFFLIKEIIKKHYPKVVVLENVKNLINHNKGHTFQKIIRELDGIGYETKFAVLNSQDFGVPQRRNRVFIVALRKTKFTSFDYEFPKGKSTNITTKEILDELVEIKYFISKNMIDTILGYGTKGYIVKPTIDTDIAKTLTATMHKMHRASQDNYYTDEFNWNRFKDDKKTKIRKLTPNEARKLQGFPDDWKHVVSDTQIYKQFGNAVTVNVAFNVAKNLMNFINDFKIHWEKKDVLK
jgi:DNA (cytosine-5)-methyltransferase 1